MDNWVLQVNQWKVVGMVSSVLDPGYPSWGVGVESAQVTAHWVLE